MIGIDCPNVDEDELRSAANDLRTLAGDLTGSTGKAKSDIESMLSNNSSQSLELFDALWQKVSGSHLPQMADGMKVVATALDASAVLVVGMKVAAIAQLAILAAEIIADQVEAFFTFGASEAEIPIEVAATRGIMKEIMDQAVKQVEQQLIQAVEGPVFQAIGNAGEELAGQLLGDALGTQKGIDLGKVASAGGSGFEQGVDSTVSNPAGAVGL